MKKYYFIIVIFAFVLLSSCSNSEIHEIGNSDQIETGYHENSHEYSVEPSTTTEPPILFYIDENGVLYDLVEGSNGEYIINAEHEDLVDTPESTAISRMGYWPYGKTLWVVFRNSGVMYAYYDVPAQTWGEFKTAKSKGEFFNEYIKDLYEYKRISK